MCTSKNILYRMYAMWILKKQHRTSHVYHVNIRKIHLEHHIYTIWTLQNITHNITCVLSEHHEIHLRTLHVYHMNIRKIRLEHHIYTMRTSQNITQNITCILRKHHKIYHKTSLYTTWTSHVQHHMYTTWISKNTTYNITCIPCEH